MGCLVSLETSDACAHNVVPMNADWGRCAKCGADDFPISAFAAGCCPWCGALDECECALDDEYIDGAALVEQDARLSCLALNLAAVGALHRVWMIQAENHGHDNDKPYWQPNLDGRGVP